MILTFTGTRRGTTPAQLLAAFNLVVLYAPERFLHGGAPGADAEIDDLVAPWYWERGSGEKRLLAAIFGTPPIGVYPAEVDRHAHWMIRAEYAAIREVYEPQDPLRRNRIMARLCHRLVACPAEQIGESLRSGTWATVRYAREAGKPVTIVRPDGKMEDR